eukprot:TRINITY_DN9827_c0_g1_i1.p1 TRINITY_DN9827_c0_g1~~TRINITY_DN9827_c0_g1_i1.p1  ORF type:complete len:257 (-),score=31.19 TRINITY_DN9827_c0_g1_i1:373-1143(-)
MDPLAAGRTSLLSAAAGGGVSPAGGTGTAVQIPPSTDNFWANEPNLIGSFDFDYDLITAFEKKRGWAALCVAVPTWPLACLTCVPCFLNKNVEWFVRSQHVALTIDGVRYTKEKRPSLCGLSCTDKGKESKTVPYDMITDCDILEPAGNACCCCIPNVYPIIHIDTASSRSGGDQGVQHELELKGLRFSTEFKQAVWAMKRNRPPPGSKMQMESLAPKQAEMTGSSAACESLLTDIRDELRKLNEKMDVSMAAAKS